MILDYSKLVPGMVIGTTCLTSPLAAIIRFTTAGPRYVFSRLAASHIVIVVREHDLYYGMEMTWPKIRQIDLCDIDKYVVFYTADRTLTNYRMQDQCNEWLLKSHYIGVKYDWKELFKFWDMPVYDDPKRLICSDLYREMCRCNKIPYPKKWNTKVSPWDIQKYYVRQS